jgi:VanZ family protein
MPAAPPAIRWSLRIITATFWIICLILTHLPAPPEFLPAADHDKIRHYLGFGLLAGMLYLTIAIARPISSLRSFLGSIAIRVLLILMIYAAVDEITQPPFGRTCDFFDWLADTAGAATAVTILEPLYLIHRKRHIADAPRIQ